MRKDEDMNFTKDMTDTVMRQKSQAWKKVQLAAIFDTYCSDVRKFYQKLAERVKESGMIGLHPFMIADDYGDVRDKAVAVMMSALIPCRRTGLFKRLDILKRLFNGSPSRYIDGGYKVVDFNTYYAGMGCTMDMLQQWTEILHQSFMSDKGMWMSNVEYFMRTSEFHRTYAFDESYSEAVFWLSESVLGTDPKDIPIPHTRCVRELLKAVVPRWKNYDGWKDMAELFQFGYPAMVWYAAQGREWLYSEHYDDICKMERNLKMKFTRSTPMDAYERWRFRKLFMKKLYEDIEQYIPYF